MKGELRKDILRLRKGLANEEVAAKSFVVAERLFNLPEFIRAKTIMFYLDFRNEVKTGKMIEKALELGKRVVVPITDTKNIKLIPSEILDFPGDLVPGTWGILEPKPECVRPVAAGDIDLVVVPGVAFDTKGNRLGYGGGFYDRFNPTTRPDTVLVALAFELQIQPDVYPEPHDYRVHYVFTEDRVIKVDRTFRD
ncbi:MAG: 5-formyltetrahydrofolate cyclo-ligase [Clostridia bacterium]|nr:5-formyltetrahydrofolate cyclo-ligase [Clostridia bacterium]